jgi:hypothetical protein
MNNAAQYIRWTMLFVLALCLGGMQPVHAQDSTAVETQAQDTSAVEEEKEDLTVKSKMSLTGSQFPDGTIELTALLRAKIKGSYQKVAHQKVSFFSVNDDFEETALGDTITGPDGMARWKVNTTGKPVNADGSYSFLARYDGNDNMNGSESDVMLQPAKLVMEAIEGDSAYTLHLVATANSADGPVPIVEAPVAVYVKRMFSSLKVGEGTTDENGEVEVDFPMGLSGDQNANLEIAARIEETDAYGNLEARMTKQWGKPVSYEIKELPNALWSDHPPVWMIVTFFVLMGTVWFHYMYIVFNLFRIKADKDHGKG